MTRPPPAPLNSPSRIFHAMETFLSGFPRYGNFFSTPWKIRNAAPEGAGNPP